MEDYFSRQRTVPDWHQPLLEAQTALLLGVGGIGCSVSRNLCRLGVREVILVDCDVVAASNVNRQVLYSTGDVGRRKVEAALDGLKQHNIRTKVTAVHCNAVTEWSKIVELARRSTVIFNGIDFGEYFDYAVSSLCVALSLPYISASSYGHSAIVDCYPCPLLPRKGPCWGCNNPPSDTAILSRLTPHSITILPSLDFLPKDSYMPATQEVGSSVLVSSLASSLASGAWSNSLHGYQLPHWTSCDIAMFEMSSFRVERSPACLICSHAPKYSSALLDIYFGSEEVRLSPVPGSTHPHTLSTATSTPSPYTQADAEQVVQRLKPFPGLEPGHAPIYLPAVPATDVPLSEDSSGDASSMPDQLQNPLLKTEDGTIRAIVSGGRSAILPTPQGCYRLKGCGCYLDQEGRRLVYPGLPLEKMEAVEGGYEVRGCCFKHTAANEQHMCDVIASALGSEGIVVGNKPLGVWQYSIPEEPVPQIAKYCGVFETLGERRLSSHLLPGLDSLLPLLLPTLTLTSALALFPTHRVTYAQDEKPHVQPTWSACCTGGQKQHEPIDMCHTPLKEAPPTSPTGELSPALLEQWCRAVYPLRDTLPLSEADRENHGSLLAALYWQLGWEVGVVSRALSTNQINWGYFLDHSPFEPHCNQHPNNFIVLPPGHSTFLAPVDFDLAFTADHFISPYSGTNDESLFRSWLESGHSEMERGLGGEQVNSGLNEGVKAKLSSSHSAVAWALRDTLLSGYRAAYSGRSRPHPLPASLRHAADCLIRLALISTSTLT